MPLFLHFLLRIVRKVGIFLFVVEGWEMGISFVEVKVFQCLVAGWGTVVLERNRMVLE